MALTKLLKDLIDGSLGTDWQSTVKTADFTAVAGQGYFVNTTSAAITVTLPNSPSAGDEVTIVDYAGTSDTNNITITSSDNINGSSNDVLINYERGGVSMVYVDATQGWIAYNAANETATAISDVPPQFNLDYLVIAGGASGGSGLGDAAGGVGGGGGGAGGLRTSYGSTSGGGASNESQLTIDPGTNYTVTVGAGGAGVAGTTGSGGSNGNNGNDSVFSTITSVKGGYGTARFAGGSLPTGGSGGGAATDTGVSGGSGTSGQGFAGGDAQGSGTTRASSSGGGAGSAGSQPTTANGANGGNGLSVSITGSAVTYAGGGGGGATTGGTGGTSQTGGNGGNANSNAGAGTANTGGGGGGGGGGTSGGDSGAGGSGVVILRYPNSYTVTIGSGLTGSTATDGSDKVTTFTAGTGTISFS